MVSVAWAIWLFPSRLNARKGHAGAALPKRPAAKCPLFMLHAFRAASDVPVCEAVWLHSGFDIAWQHGQGRIRNDVDDVSSLSEPHGPDGAMAERGRTGVEIPQPRAAGRLRQTVRAAR